MNKSCWQFSVRALLGAIALSAMAIALTLWSRNPGQYMAGGNAWGLSFLAKMFTLPVICGLIGAGIGLLASRPWIGLLVGLAIAGVLAPVLFVWWLQS